MKCTGKVFEFNRITGLGVIASKGAGGKVPFHVSVVVGGNGKLDAGDRVELEVTQVDGRP
jgi:cold shock CspA family protein